MHQISLEISSLDDEDPEFTDVIDNITVPAGRNVKLACSVKNLGSYKPERTAYFYSYHFFVYVLPPEASAMDQNSFQVESDSNQLDLRGAHILMSTGVSQ
ncbi:unnamed protein product [Ceratitis capitata]|uniref:(Mediterranean fruit fly) hypothetical protein n=1 Tax=Ceratitis capitata TaxID=7213 RepID=A0A811UFB4_CERCA|nr:unnamed protein product [Ceratitis capitata]